MKPVLTSISGPLLLGWILVAGPMPAFAGEFRVNKFTENAQQLGKVSALPDGGFIAAWQSRGEYDNTYGAFGQRYAASGKKAGKPIKISRRKGLVTQWHTDVAGLTGGGFAGVWSANMDGDSYGIYGRRFDAAGNRLGSVLKVNKTTAGEQEYPAIAALVDGGFVIVWHSANQDGSAYGVYGRRYDASGKATGGEFLINTTISGDQKFPCVAGLTGGGFVVLWDSRDQDGDKRGIFGQRYDAAGERVGGEFKANTYTTEDQAFCNVAGLTNGGFVAVWESYLQDGSGTGSFGQVYDPAGNPVWPEFRANVVTFGAQGRPKVVGLANGAFELVWHTQYQDGSGFGVYRRQSKVNGKLKSAERLVNQYTIGDQYEPSVARFGNGYVVIWSSWEQDGSNAGVYGRRYGP